MKEKDVYIIDYGVGNLGSITNMLKYLGYSSRVVGDKQSLLGAHAVILPGVGSFDHGMRMLDQRGLISTIDALALHSNVPILGICLGMQLLLDGSEEGRLPGLGLIKGEVRRFNLPALDYKVPHMGWNVVKKNGSHTLLPDNEEQRFYFVHSYYVSCQNKENVAGITTYGHDFASVVKRENIMGVQFHPEKSHQFGMTLLKNFMEMKSCCARV